MRTSLNLRSFKQASEKLSQRICWRISRGRLRYPVGGDDFCADILYWFPIDGRGRARGAGYSCWRTTFDSIPNGVRCSVVADQ